MSVVSSVLSGLLALLCIACLVAMMPLNLWLVRMIDIGRLHLFVLVLIGTVALGLTLLKLPSSAKKTRVASACVLLLAVVVTVVNVVWLAPYMPSSLDAAECAPEDRLRVLIANVELGNKNTQPLIDLAREVEPDILLTMETDEVWDRALNDLDDLMPHRVQRITGSYYGMHLQSRLPLTEGDIENPAGADTPIIQVHATLPSGDVVRFVGVHPRPPMVGQPSVYRDGQLASVALEAHDPGPPTIVAGDFNTVPWEPLFSRIRHVGGLLDPRREVGYTASYSATSWWKYWPIDHVLYEPDLRLLRFERGPSIGSDHYPMIAELCADGTPEDVPQASDADIATAHEAVRAARDAPPAKK